MSIHPLASTGFSQGAEAYERGRPSYPEASIAHLGEVLGVGPGRRVLDLAAGTGKLTRMLVPSGAALVAVEPVKAMRSRLPGADLGVGVVAAVAEALPMAAASLDAVMVGQAFHWFDAAAALVEVARVLRAGGGLGLVWNERDESVAWVAELNRLIRWDVRMPYRVGTDWCEVIDRSGLFTPAQRAERPFDQELDHATLIDRVLSTSYIAAMKPAERSEMIVGVRELVADFPPRFRLPYVTESYWCHLT